MMASANVYIVDDDISVRESLELLIRSAGWRPETFASGAAFLTRPRVEVPSCVVLDVSLSDSSGLDLQRRIADDRRNLPVIFITGHSDVSMSVKAMKAGAVDFLTKPFCDDALLDAISHAITRSRDSLDRDAELRALLRRYESLSPREREVLALVVEGLMNKQVAVALSISEITVKAHRGKVMRKMNARSLADLVRMAARIDTNV